MNKPQLKSFQSSMRRLNKTLEPVFEHWEDHMTKVISVLLQNMGADSEGCHGYSVETEFKRVSKAKAAVLSLCKYYEYHLTNFIKQEIEIAEMDAYHLDN